MNKKIDKNIKKVIKESKEILIIASRPVDLDGIASVLLLREYFESLGKNVRSISPRNIPSYLSAFKLEKEIEILDPKDLILKNFDLIVAVDGGNTKQFAVVDKDEDFDFQKHKRVLNIDHHRGNSHFGKFEIYDPDCSSTAEIVLRNFADVSELSSKLATLSYAAIVSDTGNFKHNISSETFALVSDLLKKDVKHNFVLEIQFANHTLEAFYIFADLVQDTICDTDLKYSIVEVDMKKEAEKHKCSIDIVKEGVSLYRDYFARSVKNIWISIVISNHGTEKNAAMRGSTLYNRIPLPQICEKFGKGGGGGHFNSAGFAIKREDIHDFDEKFKDYIEKLYNQYYE